MEDEKYRKQEKGERKVGEREEQKKEKRQRKKTSVSTMWKTKKIHENLTQWPLFFYPHSFFSPFICYWLIMPGTKGNTKDVYDPGLCYIHTSKIT